MMRGSPPAQTEFPAGRRSLPMGEKGTSTVAWGQKRTLLDVEL